MPTQTPPVSVLAFDPVSRRSSRRHAAETQAAKALARRVKRLDRAAHAELVKVATALGVTPAALDAHDGIYYLSDEILRIEAAYRRSPQAGRLALVAEINAFYRRGYDTGLNDAGISEASGG